MSKFLHGTHDVEGAEWMLDKPGWIVVTEALGSDPRDLSGGDYSHWTSRGFSIIARLNNGYFPVGTIPDSNHYPDFAQRCANFVAATPGITVAIIGNEPNHQNERPYNEIITPTQYAKCFDECYKRIKRVDSKVQVAIAGSAPWDATTRYPGNAEGDWIRYFRDTLNTIIRCDAITIHTYTHGTDPSLIHNQTKMDYPFQRYYYHFPAYRDYMLAIPSHSHHLPVYITETDQIVPWKDTNSGWVKEAYEEINFWNRTIENQKIHALCLYRSNKDDQWSIQDKKGVIDDFKEAVSIGYTFPVRGQPTPPPDITPPTPQPPTTPPDMIDIDPALIARGVEFDFVTPPAGTWYWRMTYANWLNEEEADRMGPDHHILGVVLDEEGKEKGGVKMKVAWPSGSTTITSKKPTIPAQYNYDYPMSSSLNEFSIWIDDGNYTDLVRGIGMGMNGNPSIHTSTWIEWQWTQAQEVIPIPPIDPAPPIEEGSVLHHPLPLSVITQDFYQNPQDYAKFGLSGHNGTDFGGRPSRTPIHCLCDGTVAFVGFDAGYGNYIRIGHRQDDMMCYTMYCHLDEPSLRVVGEVVKDGDIIGLLGTTGNSTGVHLHLEIRLMEEDGTYREGTPMSKGRVDPRTFCVDRGLRL